MDDLEFIRSLGIATLIGALIGLEREYHHRLAGERSFAGLRTFMFFSVLGNLSAWLGAHGFPVMLPLGFLSLSALLAVGYHRASEAGKDPGMTTEIAALITFLIGALTATGRVPEAVALGVVVATLLSVKPALRVWIDRITREDIYTTLKFAFITFVILPILPNRDLGPFDAFNPYNVWLMVVLISGVSFVGYVAMKALGGGRGLWILGVLGGLVSSTAFTFAFARRSRDAAGSPGALAGAIVVASTVMVVRVGFLMGLVAPALLVATWPALALMTAGGLLGARLVSRGTRVGSGSEAPDLRNPLRLPAALTFSAIYAVVLVGVRWAEQALPSGSIEILAGVSGLTDVDAITLALARLVGRDFPVEVASSSVILALLANTATKLIIGFSGGDPVLRRPLAAGLALQGLGGIAAFVILRVL